MARTWRTLFQSIVSPVLSTSLYFVVFGSAIGSRITPIDGVSYGAFIVPGLIMLTLLTRERHPTPRSASIFRASLARSTKSSRRRFPPLEVVLGYVGAAATKSVVLGLIICGTARLFVPLRSASIRSGCWRSWC